MEFTGKFAGFTQDVVSGESRIGFIVEHDRQVLNKINDFKDAPKLKIKVDKYRKKRSLDANAYYWVLITKMADVLHVSKPFMHNYIMRKYGQIALFDGQALYAVLPDTMKVEKQVDESQTYHLKPTAEVKKGKDGKMYRTYMMLKGSHEFDTKEMSHLIEGLVSDAQELGIETLPPDELERMINAWRPKS